MARNYFLGSKELLQLNSEIVGSPTVMVPVSTEFFPKVGKWRQPIRPVITGTKSVPPPGRVLADQSEQPANRFNVVILFINVLSEIMRQIFFR